MPTFKNEAILDYPVDKVFKVFRDTAKRDFPKFNDKKPIGCSIERNVGTYSLKTARMKVEITDYKPNEIYEISSHKGKTLYKSNYQFVSLGENKTKLLLTESEYTQGALNFLNTIIASIFFKGRIKKRFY